MKVVKNCGLAFKLVFRYAPLHGLLLILGFYIPGFFPGLQIILVQKVVDSGILYTSTGEGLTPMIVQGVLLVLMLFFWTMLQRLGSYENKVIETKLTQRMARDIMDKLENLEYSAFEQKGAQEVLQRISREPWKVVSQCFFWTVITTQAVVSILFTLGVYLSISVWIGVGLLIIAVPMVALYFNSAYRLREIYRGATDDKRRMADLKQLLRNKHAVYEMKVFESQSLLSEKWNEYSGKIVEETKKESGKLIAMDAGSRFLGLIYYIFIVAMLSYALLHGTVTLGQFTAALGSIGSITNKMTNSSWQVSEAIRRALELDFYREFLALPDRTDKRSVPAAAGSCIEFDHVSFRYPGTDREVLKDVTFRIEEGERVAFVGENGAGKSTVIKLLCGLYEPVKGRVTIGGVDVRDLSEELKREMISAVFQDFQSYELTLRENVAFGCLEKLNQDEALLHALSLAGAKELADTEEAGLDRNLGHLTEDGKDLSKGQWQRVAMARAFLSDAKYVILDEPTASLDPIAESHMYENFARIFSERGTIMISHRLASAKMAEKILVLDDGKIVQTGNHEELMEQEGLYRSMYLAQSSWYVKEQGGDREDGEHA